MILLFAACTAFSQPFFFFTTTPTATAATAATATTTTFPNIRLSSFLYSSEGIPQEFVFYMYILPDDYFLFV